MSLELLTTAKIAKRKESNRLLHYPTEAITCLRLLQMTLSYDRPVVVTIGNDEEGQWNLIKLKKFDFDMNRITILPMSSYGYNFVKASSRPLTYRCDINCWAGYSAHNDSSIWRVKLTPRADTTNTSLC